MTKKSRQKFEYRENEKSFQDEIKSIFITYKGLSLKQIKQFFFERWEFCEEAIPVKRSMTEWNGYKLRLSIEIYIADFFQFSTTVTKTSSLGVRLGTRPDFIHFTGFVESSWFSNSLNVKFLGISYTLFLVMTSSLVSHAVKKNLQIKTFAIFESLQNLLLNLPSPCISESFIKIKINLNFCFHTSLWYLKRFYEGL